MADSVAHKQVGVHSAQRAGALVSAVARLTRDADALPARVQELERAQDAAAAEQVAGEHAPRRCEGHAAGTHATAIRAWPGSCEPCAKRPQGALTCVHDVRKGRQGAVLRHVQVLRLPLFVLPATARLSRRSHVRPQTASRGSWRATVDAARGETRGCRRGTACVR